MENTINEIHLSDIELENSPSFRGTITIGEKKYIIKKDLPISEHITSHLMGLMGIPVQKTSLALLDGRPVVLCEDSMPRDMKYIPGVKLFEELFPDEDIRNSYGPLHLKKVLKHYLGDGAHEALLLIAFKSIFDCVVKQEDFGPEKWGILQGEKVYLAPFHDNALSLIQLMKAIDERSFSFEKAIYYAIGEFWTPFISFKNGYFEAKEGFEDITAEAIGSFKKNYTVENFCSFVKETISDAYQYINIEKEAGMFLYAALILRYLHVIEGIGKDELLEVANGLPLYQQ